MQKHESMHRKFIGFMTLCVGALSSHIGRILHWNVCKYSTHFTGSCFCILQHSCDIYTYIPFQFVRIGHSNGHWGSHVWWSMAKCGPTNRAAKLCTTPVTITSRRPSMLSLPLHSYKSHKLSWQYKGSYNQVRYVLIVILKYMYSMHTSTPSVPSYYCCILLSTYAS